MNRVKLALIYLMISMLLASCLKFETPQKVYKNQNISILYFDENSFYQNYGDFLRGEFHDINIT